MRELFMSPVELVYEARVALFSSVAEGAILHGGAPVGAVQRRGGPIGVDVAVHVPAHDPVPLVEVIKAGLGTGSWRLRLADGRAGSISHRWLSTSWTVEIGHVQATMTTQMWGRPVAEIEVGGRHVASVQRESMWVTGLLSRSRSWTIQTHAPLDDVVAAIILAAPVVLDHRERAQESGAAAGGGA